MGVALEPAIMKKHIGLVVVALASANCVDHSGNDVAFDEVSDGDGKADGSTTLVDLGGVMMTSDGPGCPLWGRTDGYVGGPRAINMHLFPGAARHGTTIVIALEQAYSDAPEHLANVRYTREQFEAFWGASLGTAVYRGANVLFCSTLSPTTLSLQKFNETGVPAEFEAASASVGECRSFTGPTDAGTVRQASPGSGTPGRTTAVPGPTKPFITEICWLPVQGPGQSVNRGFSFVEIYVP
jgi:hypothetical protein